MPKHMPSLLLGLKLLDVSENLFSENASAGLFKAIGTCGTLEKVILQKIRIWGEGRVKFDEMKQLLPDLEIVE